MTEISIVLTTTNSEESAQKLALQLVEARLAACVQIDGPIRSVYRWQKKIESDNEWRLMIKTCKSRYDEVEQFLLQHHSYEVPEVVAILVANVSPAYAEWLGQQLAADGESSS